MTISEQIKVLCVLSLIHISQIFLRETTQKSEMVDSFAYCHMLYLLSFS